MGVPRGACSPENGEAAGGGKAPHPAAWAAANRRCTDCAEARGDSIDLPACLSGSKVKDSTAAVLVAIASAVAAAGGWGGKGRLAGASQGDRPLPRLGTAPIENSAGWAASCLLLDCEAAADGHAVLCCARCASAIGFCFDVSCAAAAGQKASTMSATPHLYLMRLCEGGDTLCWGSVMWTSRCRLREECSKPSLERLRAKAKDAVMLLHRLASMSC